MATWRSPSEMTDDEIFTELCVILKIDEKNRGYSGLWRAVSESSYKRDVSYEIRRWAGFLPTPQRVTGLVQPILERSFRAEALNWLKSTTPEGMRYGNASRELRIKEARGFAEKAGVSLEELAEEVGVEI